MLLPQLLLNKDVIWLEMLRSIVGGACVENVDEDDDEEEEDDDNDEEDGEEEDGGGAVSKERSKNRASSTNGLKGDAITSATWVCSAVASKLALDESSRRAIERKL